MSKPPNATIADVDSAIAEYTKFLAAEEAIAFDTVEEEKEFLADVSVTIKLNGVESACIAAILESVFDRISMALNADILDDGDIEFAHRTITGLHKLSLAIESACLVRAKEIGILPDSTEK